MRPVRPVRPWADRGFAAACIVYSRTGDADQISDIVWALLCVAQEANPTVPLFLMGHSMVRAHSIYPYIFLVLLINSFAADLASTGRCIGTLVREASQYAGERFAAVGDYSYRVKSLYSPHQTPTEHDTPAGRSRTRHPSEPEHTSIS